MGNHLDKGRKIYLHIYIELTYTLISLMHAHLISIFCTEHALLNIYIVMHVHYTLRIIDLYYRFQTYTITKNKITYKYTNKYNSNHELVIFISSH